MTSATAPARQLLALADAILLLADGLRPPDRARVPSPEDAAELGEAAFPGDEPLSAALGALCTSFAQTPRGEWSDEYHRLFEGAMLCPINESAYVRRDKGAILADLCGFYRAFGFEPGPDAGEKPDHLRCELEFLAMLLVMLAQAVQQHREVEQKITRTAIAGFANDHLAEWLAVFSNQLAQTTGFEAYRLLAAALSGAWRALMRIVDLPDVRQPQPEPAATEDDWPMECGMAPEPPVRPCNLTLDGRELSCSSIARDQARIGQPD